MLGTGTELIKTGGKICQNKSSRSFHGKNNYNSTVLLTL